MTVRRTPAPRPLRVLLVGPSLDILGGQAVQAARLHERLREIPGLAVDFLPVNPRLPGPLRRLQQVRYVRTVATSAAYLASLLRRVPRYDVVHAFSASYTSYLLAPLPALAVAKLFGRRTVLNYRSGEADASLREHRQVTQGESAEDRDHDGRRARDYVRRPAQTEGD